MLAAAPPAAAQTPLSVAVGTTPTGRPLPGGFVGVSLEYGALHLYTGRDPRAVDPALVGLLRGLAPGQAPVIRIGGDSADFTWWPTRGAIPPPGVRYAITPGWLRTTQALAADTGGRLIMGLNLAGHRPALATAEARAFLQGIGRRYVHEFEPGNEPDLYGAIPWFRDRRGKLHYARSRSYGLSSYISEFSRWRAALPSLPLAGPALASLTWLAGLSEFLAAEPRVNLVTVHRYPLLAGVSDPTAPNYPSLANLLSDRAASGLAQQVAPYAAAAHARGLGFRVDEINSAAHSGQPGLSNTFASALWVLDTLFNLAAAGVDGVNVHSLPGAAYELFTFSRPRGAWEAFVHPEYYGMLMFGRAFPPGAELLPVTAPAGPLKAWATRGTDGHTRVVLINKDPAVAYPVELQVPGAAAASLEWLEAPSLAATAGVTLGEQTFGAASTGGTLPAPDTQPVAAAGGAYTVQVPPASAVLLTQ
ncbi:MAG: hypothetical protein JO168_25960 [Solirubrobacterales bacterium]|nr:hypothetical protein [Solirubrobacterales bacterium]MBV9714726.1 hypothetical protein [Solirubrobacterales bacterium]